LYENTSNNKHHNYKNNHQFIKSCIVVLSDHNMAVQHKIGRSGEYLAASYLARIFDEVLSTSESSRYDFLCTSDQANIKVQVKTTNSTFDHHGSKWVRWDIKKRITNKDKHRVYSAEEVDVFAFVCLLNDTVVFKPNRRLGKTFQKKLEYIDTVNSMQSLELALAAVGTNAKPLL